MSPQVNKIDLIIANDCVEYIDDNKLLSEFPYKDKMFIQAKITQHNSNRNNSSNPNANSSPESSSDEAIESDPNQQHFVIESAKIENEICLPSVVRLKKNGNKEII